MSANTPSCKSLNILELSDVHLGHPNTPTEHILRSLRHLIPDTQQSWDLDIIFIAGDLFDRLLEYDSPDITDIELWFLALAKMCARHGIILRGMEGTPFHDRKQMARLFNLLKGVDFQVDAKFICELTIERIESLGLDVLYIPDEWRPRCDDTWLEVVDLLKQKGLEQVDITVMHGAFHHQMPKNIHAQLELHDAERYISITRRVVYVGHVHQMSNYKNMILAAGSTDRLCHGDEGGKGVWRSTLNPDGTQTHTFVPNKLALPYITVDCIGKEGGELHRELEGIVKKLPEGSHIRLVAKKDDVAMQAIDGLRVRYPKIHWAVKEPKSTGDVEKPVLLDTRPKFQWQNITPDNVLELLMTRIHGKYPAAMAERAEARLKESLDG